MNRLRRFYVGTPGSGLNWGFDLRWSDARHTLCRLSLNALELKFAGRRRASCWRRVIHRTEAAIRSIRHTPRVEVAQSLMLRSREPLCAIALRFRLNDQPRLTRLLRRVVGEDEVRKTTMHKHAIYALTLGGRRALTPAMIESSNPARLGIEHRFQALGLVRTIRSKAAGCCDRALWAVPQKSVHDSPI